jgi:hypothetical protein
MPRGSSARLSYQSPQSAAVPRPEQSIPLPAIPEAEGPKIDVLQFKRTSTGQRDEPAVARQVARPSGHRPFPLGPVAVDGTSEGSSDVESSDADPLAAHKPGSIMRGADDIVLERQSQVCRGDCAFIRLRYCTPFPLMRTCRFCLTSRLTRLGASTSLRKLLICLCVYGVMLALNRACPRQVASAMHPMIRLKRRCSTQRPKLVRRLKVPCKRWTQQSTFCRYRASPAPLQSWPCSVNRRSLIAFAS